jgi:hypothetical protein
MTIFLSLVSRVTALGTLLVCFMIVSCTGQSTYQQNNVQLQKLESAAQPLIMQGQDKDTTENSSSGVYGSNILINFIIDVNALHLPSGTQITVTPTFAKNETEVPANMHWQFSNGKQSFTIIANTQDRFQEILSIAVDPSKDYYYHSFRVMANITIAGKQILVDSKVNAYVFGIMNKDSVNKIYFGDYDTATKHYNMPQINGYPTIQDDGSMLLSKYLSITTFDPLPIYSVLTTTYYDKHHIELLMGDPLFSGDCSSGTDVISLGTQIFGYSRLEQQVKNVVSWKDLGTAVAKKQCKNKGENKSDWFFVSRKDLHPFDKDAFDNTVTNVDHLSSEGKYVAINNNTLYAVLNNQYFKLLNPDATAFNKVKDNDNSVVSVSDAGIVLATDMRKNLSTQTTNNNWVLCSTMVNNCFNITEFHSEDALLPNTGVLSASGDLIYAVIKTNGKNTLKLWDRSSDKKIVIPTPENLNLDIVKVLNFATTNQGLLTIQFDDLSVTPHKRSTLFYSYINNKWLDATDIAKYMGLSNYLINNLFHGVMSLSSNGKAMALYITNDDDFTKDKINATAIVSYTFGKDYLTEYQSMDDMIKDLGHYAN